MPSSGVNEEIGQTEQHEDQENGGDDGNVKKSGNIDHEVIVRSSSPLNKENMDGVLHNHSKQDGDDSCEEFFDSSRVSSAANSEGRGCSDKEKGSLFCRIIRSPSFTKRGSIGNVLNSLYPNTKNEGPASCASICKSGASMGLPEANQSGTTDVPKSKNIKKSSSNAESLKAIVQKNVVDRCQGVQRARRNSIASYKPMTGALETSLRESIQNGRWNSGKAPVMSCEISCNAKRDYVSHICNGQRDPGRVKVDDKLKISNLTNPSCGMGKSQRRVDYRAASPKPIRLTNAEDLNDPQIRSQQTSCTVKGNCSSALPSRGIDPPERKSSATIIKRSPVAIVIPNDKTKEKENASEGYQVPSVVSFINSSFKPLGQEEAEEYSVMKKEEARKSSKHASHVTCYDEEGAMIRKPELGTAREPPLVEDSLPTNERFVALSERFAALKAKIRGNDMKQKSQFSSLASSQLNHCSSDMSDALEFSKCPTALETAPLGVFQDRLSGISDGLLDHKIEKTSSVEDGGRQSGTIDSQNSGVHRMAITFNIKEIERHVDKQSSKNVGRAYDYETEGDINWGRSVDENNNEMSSAVNNAPKIDVTFDGIGSRDKAALVRPESFAPRTRASVVAKLMDRKMIIRKRQSIEPKMMKRQSMVYDEYSSPESGIPRTFEQFEWIRAHVENTVLREPVRHEALTIKELLNGLSSCLSETELIAICKECSKTLRTLDALGSLPNYVSLDSVIINPSGTVKFKHLSTGISVDDYYLAPEHSKRFASEKTCVFSLGASLWSAADWRLTEAEKPSLSSSFQELLTSMTNDEPDARPSLQDVLQTCDSLQIDGEMTSRERCQALLWEYQASTAMRKEDASQRKMLEEEKKCHDTLMGSISVAASCKGFLKQTPVPQERNLFVKTEAHREQKHESDVQTLKGNSQDCGVFETTLGEADNDTVLKSESIKVKEFRNNEEETGKGIPSSFSTKDGNNNTADHKRRYSLTEEQKKQLLTLLASSKTFEVEKNKEREWDEPTNPSSKTSQEDKNVKPPSPSFYTYPHFTQTEGCIMFDPMAPASRSVSPKMFANVIDGQRSAVPNFVPIAVPVPSVTPVTMSPFWYMPQGGLMPYPQPGMSPVQFVPIDPSTASNQSVMSINGGESESFDEDPRSFQAGSSISRPDRTKVVGSSSQKSQHEQDARRSPSLQNKKASKLPRPVRQTPATKRSGSSGDEIKPRTPSPYVGRRSSLNASPGPRSEALRLNRSREDVDSSAKTKLQKRASVGSLTISKPSSTCRSSGAVHRSLSSPFRSRSNSLGQKSTGNVENRPNSAAKSRSNSPFSNMVSKFEQMSQESSNSSPRVRRSSVSSIISKFGSSSLVPGERIVKGQVKPNVAKSGNQNSSKTGHLRQSPTNDRAFDYSSTGHSGSPNEKLFSRSDSTARASPGSDERLFKIASVGQGQESGSGESKRGDLTVQSRHGLLLSGQSSSTKTTEAGPGSLSGNINKWSSQGNLLNDDKSHTFPISALSLEDDSINCQVIPGDKVSFSIERETDCVENSSGSYLTELSRRSSLDSEPVREKGSSKSGPKDAHVAPERDISKQPFDVKDPIGFLRSPNSNAKKFEVPVGLTMLESTDRPAFPSALHSLCGVSGGKEGGSAFPSAPLNAGGLKEIKLFDCAANSNFKCGEMKPERDSNCLEKGNSCDKDVNFNCASVSHVERFERKVLRSMGGAEDELLLCSSRSDGKQGATSKGENSDSCSSKVLQHDLANIEKGTTKEGNHLSSVAISATQSINDCKTSKARSVVDTVTASKNPRGNGQPAEERSRASSSRNPRSPLTLRKLPSNPLPKGGDESRVTAVMDKQNSLPGSKATKALTKSDNRLNSQGVVLHPNSSLGQKQTQKQSSARDISSTFLSKNPTLAHEKKIELLGKNNPNSKLASILHPKEKDIKPKTSTSTISLSNKATDSLSSVLLERKPNSSDARQDEKANLEASSASNTVRFPYTRRASTPLKESSTVKLPTKSANNPTSRHDPKQTKDKDFFALQSTYPGNSSGSKTSCTSNIDHTNDGLKSVHPDFGKPKGLLESNEVNRMASSSVGSSHRASHAATKFVDQTVSELNLGDSGVFYVSSFEEKTSKGKLVSPAKRFPSSGSSDSGLNMSDSEDTRKSDGNQNKEYKSVAPTTRNYIRPPQTPSSPKFEMGSIIFYNPKDRHDNTSLISERGSTGAESEPGHLVNVLSSGESKEAPTFLKNSSQDSSYSPNKTVGNDGDRLKNVKGLVSSIPNSPGANDTANSHGDKPKDARTTAKVGSVADLLKLTSKDRLPSPTLPPDIPGKPTSKSPPSASSVASKELLGQLVKKVLNSAAAKQGSSPKESFAESTSLTAIEDDKERQSIHGTMSLSPRETSEAKGKAKSNTKGVCNTTGNLNQAQAYRDSNETSKGRVEKVATVSQISDAGFSLGLREDLVTSGNVSETESSPRLIVEQSLGTTEEDMLSKIVDLIHDEFAFDGYLDDGVEDVNMAEYVLSLAGMSEENFKEAVTDQFSDLYWDEDLLRAMYETLVDGQQTRRSSESTVSDMSRSESSNLSREESYLSLEPLYVNSISRSSSERSGTGARDVLVSPLGETTEFLPIKVIAPDMQGDILGLLNPIFEDYHRTMGIKLASSAEDLLDKLGTKIMEISQQLTLERRAKKKNMTAYNKTADAENKKDMKELSLKLVTEIEQSDKKIVYLKHIQWKLRNVYAERFGLDTLLLHSFLVSYNKTCVTLEPEYNNSFLNFSPIWNQTINENSEIVDESSFGPSLQSGTKLGLFSYLFDRHAMSQSFVRYFFYTYRYVATSQELFNFIRDKCTASLRTDSSGQVYNHQLQIRYRALDLMSDWIDGYYQFDFKSNPKLIEELLAFVKDELILVDRSERGHFLMEIVAEKQKQDSNNNSLSEESMDSVAVLQLEDPHGLNLMVGKKDSPRKPLGSRKSKSPVQCFRRASSETKTAYKATLYLKALSVLDHSSRILAEQLTLIQQDLFTDIHPVHFLNSRVHGIGVGRCQSPTRERDSIFGFSTGNCRLSEFSAPDQGPLSLGNNLYVSEPTSDGTLEQVLEHSQDVSLWIAVEICSASSVKVLRAISEIVKPKATCDMFVCLQRRLEDMLMEQAQLALITKFVNAAHYCCEIRNFATCLQIIDALEMFVVRHLPVWKQVPTKTTEILEELKAMKVLLKTDSSWLMRGESSREKPTIPCFLLFVIHVQQQELGGFTLPSDMYKWTKMRCVARLVDQLRLFKQMRYAFQADEELKERLKQRIHECKNENLHALASENASNFHLSSSHGSRKFHDALKKMRASFGGFS